MDISATLLKREAGIADQHVFNLTLPYTATPITNQKASGRCWLFASTNVVRYTAAQKLGAADFELSQVRRFFQFQQWVSVLMVTVPKHVVVPFLLGQAREMQLLPRTLH
jgi:aminopeptidase C